MGRVYLKLGKKTVHHSSKHSNSLHITQLIIIKTKPPTGNRTTELLNIELIKIVQKSFLIPYKLMSLSHLNPLTHNVPKWSETL